MTPTEDPVTTATETPAVGLFARSPVPVVVRQHVEEAAHLRDTRSILVRAPQARLLHLARLDERIAAHLDGIVVAGEEGARRCREALDPPGAGSMFTATVQAIESHNSKRQLATLLALAGSSSEGRRGVLSAFGWVSGASLRGITKSLLESNDPWLREVGISACAMHRVDPGARFLQRMIEDAANASLTSRALRVAMALGLTELRDACDGLALSNCAPPIAACAAHAALVLGDRLAAVDALRARATKPGAERSSALSSWLKLALNEEARAALKALLDEPTSIRTLIRAIGVAGDSHHVPWLIARMDDLTLTRLAGESFSLITGLDLGQLDLDRKPPEDLETGPNDDPDDADVALDEDESLPWPDPLKIAAWWRRNGARFDAGTRYFMGQPPSTAHCFLVLQTGCQRQRRHAAEYLCLLQPGTPLFNIAAPAWRQQRLLTQMSGS